MAYIYNLTDTWDSSGTTWAGIRLDVTDSGSSSTSKLMNLLRNGTTLFNVAKTGDVYTAGNLDVTGTITGADTLNIGTSGLSQKIAADNGGTLIDIGSVSTAAKGTLFLQNSSATPASGALGNALAFSAVGSGRRKAMIASYQVDSNQAKTGLKFYTNDTTTLSSDAVFERMSLSGTNGLVLTNAGLTISNPAVTAPAASDGNVFSGTYTPTLTNTTNIDTSTAVELHYNRVGNVVTVAGRVDINATAATTDTILRMTLPIASNFTASGDCGGTGACISTGSFGLGNIAIVANATTDEAEFRLRPSTALGLSYNFSFTYRIR